MIEVKRLDKYTKKKREACHTYQEMNADTGYFCLEDFSNRINTILCHAIQNNIILDKICIQAFLIGGRLCVSY